MSLPGGVKELVELIDQRIVGGKTTSTALLYFFLIAFVTTVIAAVIGAGRVILSFLPSTAPVRLESRDWVSLGVVVALFAGGLWFVQRRLRKLEATTPMQDAVEMQTRLIRKVDAIEARVSYIESNLADQMRELVAQELLKHDFGIESGHEGPRLSNAEQFRLEQARKVLREAAEMARATGEDKISFKRDATTERAALHVIFLHFVREFFSPRVIADFKAHEEVRSEKMKLRGQRPDGRQHFIKMAEYFEALAGGLTLDDIDPEADLPGSFKQYRETNRWTLGKL